MKKLFRIFPFFFCPLARRRKLFALRLIISFGANRRRKKMKRQSGKMMEFAFVYTLDSKVGGQWMKLEIIREMMGEGFKDKAPQ
jgi:hypothetical protein